MRAISKAMLIASAVCCLNLSAFAQDISLNISNVTVKEAMTQLKKISGYSFVFSSADVNTKQLVSVSAENVTIQEIVNQILKGQTGLDYEIQGKKIVLKKVQSQQPKSSKSINVTGKVVDAKGEPIIGATIKEEGTSNGTITDFDGNFILNNVSMSTKLSVSYIGYKNFELIANKAALGVITLREDTKLLDEVVVVGYGTQKKADLTGSVANVGADKLNTQSNTTIGQALQGKIAGVDIVSQGGMPGSGTRVMVRGIGTLNNSTPLYIVDGMYMSGIDHINPSDIESIDVLKDASSAAIYGSRAANGVVIVTTKSGTNTEGKPIIDLSANIGVTAPSKYLDMLDAAGWAEVTTIAREAANLPVLEMATDLASKPNNDWQDIMMGPALMQNYNLSVRGGGKYSTYYTSAGYTSQDGVIKGTQFDRYTLQSKMDFKRGIFQAGTNLILAYDDNKPLVSDVRGGMVGHIIQALPTLEKYDEHSLGGYGQLYGDVTNLYHPLVMTDENLMDRNEDNLKVFANAYVSVELIKGLKYKLNFTPDFQFYRYNNYVGMYDCGLSKKDVSAVVEQQKRTRNILVEHLLTFDRTFGDHKVSLLAGYSYQDTRIRYLEGSAQGMPEGIKEIDAASQGFATKGFHKRSVLTSIMGRAFYSYKNRYLLTATIRRDGSSKFAKKNRYGNFPSASIGWNIAEEDFVKNNISWLDQLKLRGGYGVLGNQEINDYQFTSVVTPGINYPDGNGGLIQGAFPKDFANPNIKWEETSMTNIGLDFMALRNRFTLTADWYVKNTKDILLSVPIPISTGGANDPIRNAGKIRNKGFEFNLGWNDYASKDFSYSVNFIGSFNSNEVVSMGTDSQVINSGATNQNINTSKTLAGYPIAGFWLIPTLGYFNSVEEVQSYNKDGKLVQPSAEPGDIKFQDTNNDGKITDDDRVYCGSPFPKFTYSINGNVTYKNFDFSLGFQGVSGNKIYNATRQTLEDVTKGTNFLASTLDYWTPENKNAAHPRLIWTDPNRNTRAESDRYLENGSYFRLRSFQIGYTFPNAWFKGIVEKARVYFNAENLFTITSYTGYTPDVNSTNVYSRGFDEFIYPSNRTFMFGLNVTF